MSQDEGVSRRTFLFGTAGATAAAAAGTAAAQENNSSGGDGVGNASAGGSATGNASAGGNTSAGADQGGAGNQSGSGSGGGTVTVAVGPNGDFVFRPGTNQPLTIAPGTTVRFVWESDNHNIVVDSQPSGASWSGVEQLHNQGFTAEHTFDTTGQYHYICEPHESLGMVADIVVEEGAGGGGNVTGGGNESGSGGGGQTVSKTVAVGPNGNFTFEPSEVVITPGSTVTWEWESDNHNVVPQSQPDGASWQGEGSQGTTFNSGHTYEHTFETLGSYEYVCTPHESQGMTGTVTVQETLPTPEPAASQPTVPDSAKSLGVASGLAMIATLGLSFFFLKYGGDYETPEQ